ncbi:type ISP restriction/modification enzyme [Flavobacterium sp. HJJ]|uniref:type ISP restriction/modification enzyme n=1 Tax=Flavobacterium sp. HJJ TaxID=2783792 RepID=UPI00188B7E10|nr:type ISP restriction/modification enzyme [Flavobacterium sp. HJJ]MBF4470022.1 hypothetical protein [Flavobacterium sp. HJJ]
MKTFSLYSSILKLIAQKKIIDTAENQFNINPKIIKQSAAGLGLTFVSKKEQEGSVCLADSHEVRPEFKETFTSEDLFNYIYAVIHSSKYREENLKTDSQNIPIQTDSLKFWKLVQFGRELRKIHLLKNDNTVNSSAQFTNEGNTIVKHPKFKTFSETHFSPSEENCADRNLGRVYISENQFFDNIPETVWNFCIDDYQPAKKWLQDRKECELTPEDISQYQKIIAVLTETVQIAKKINKLDI